MTSETSWTLIRGTANGDERARDDFVRRYFDVVRSCLFSLWRGTQLAGEADDAALYHSGPRTRIEREIEELLALLA